jgi:peptidoglycan hydrolase CwlO-like protein
MDELQKKHLIDRFELIVQEIKDVLLDEEESEAISDLEDKVSNLQQKVDDLKSENYSLECDLDYERDRVDMAYRERDAAEDLAGEREERIKELEAEIEDLKRG